jgi:hypothetical protein
MTRIVNVSTGEIVYIESSATIPDGWIVAPLTLQTSASAQAPSSVWLWIILGLVILGFIVKGKMKWTD